MNIHHAWKIHICIWNTLCIYKCRIHASIYGVCKKWAHTCMACMHTCMHKTHPPSNKLRVCTYPSHWDPWGKLTSSSGHKVTSSCWKKNHWLHAWTMKLKQWDMHECKRSSLNIKATHWHSCMEPGSAAPGEEAWEARSASLTAACILWILAIFSWSMSKKHMHVFQLNITDQLDIRNSCMHACICSSNVANPCWLAGVFRRSSLKPSSNVSRDISLYITQFFSAMLSL